MLKTFKYFDSPIHEIQEHIEEIVMLWIKASVPFNENLLRTQKLKDLAQIKVDGAKLIDTIAHIYEEFMQESLCSIQQHYLIQDFDSNNEIALLCENDWINPPVYYLDLPLSDDLKGRKAVKAIKATKTRVAVPGIKAKKGLLQIFFENAYNELLNRKGVTDNYESPKAYFDKLVTQSNMENCPFCGLTELKSKYDDGRDAFDHYLPKALYPFSSVNFQNLVPMCHTCNSGHKLAKDPLHSDKSDKSTRRKTFYPFSEKEHEITITINFTRSGVRYDRLTNADLRVNLTCATHPEEVVTWNDIFDIKKRYQAKICQKILTWIDSIRKEYNKKKLKRLVSNFSVFLDAKIEYYQEDWFEEKNFLKYAIFSEMKRVGTLEEAFGEV